jgi:hypothetical protein
MLGAIVGDIAGSVYEFDDQFRSKDFPLFREDSKFTDDRGAASLLNDSL